MTARDNVNIGTAKGDNQRVLRHNSEVSVQSQSSSLDVSLIAQVGKLEH